MFLGIKVTAARRPMPVLGDHYYVSLADDTRTFCSPDHRLNMLPWHYPRMIYEFFQGCFFTIKTCSLVLKGVLGLDCKMKSVSFSMKNEEKRNNYSSVLTDEIHPECIQFVKKQHKECS